MLLQMFCDKPYLSWTQKEKKNNNTDPAIPEYTAILLIMDFFFCPFIFKILAHNFLMNFLELPSILQPR